MRVLKTSGFLQRLSATYPRRWFVTNNGTVDVDKSHALTEAELETWIESLEDASTSAAFAYSSNKLRAVHGQIMSLHKIMSLCAHLGTVRGAELAERVLWIALGDDSDSSMKRSKTPLSHKTVYPDYKDHESQRKTTANGPSREMYTMAIKAWTSVAEIYGKRHTRSFHRHLETTQTNNGVETLNIAANAANRALQILDFMWEEYQRCYVKNSVSKDTNDRFQQYMRRLSQGDNSFECPQSIPPDNYHYTSVIRAFAYNVTSKDAPYQAERLLRQMEKLSGIEELRCMIESSGSSSIQSPLEKYLNLDRDLIPDRVCYNAVLNAWSRNRAIPISEKKYAIRQILRKMETFSKVLQDEKLLPNTMSYNLLIMAYSSAAVGPDQEYHYGHEAESILKEMISLSSRFPEPAQRNHGGYDDSIDDDRSNSTLPNIKSYNGVINAWAVDSVRIGVHGPLRAELILKALLRNAYSSSQDELDIPIVTSVLPDTTTFNSVINAWSKSRDRDAGSRAENLLQFMNGNNRTAALSMETLYPVTEQLFSEDLKTIRFKNVDVQHKGLLYIEPDAITFNTVVSAWCNSDTTDAAQKAFALLSFMIAEFKSGNNRCKPTALSFSVTINKLAQSCDSDRGEKAQSLLESFLELQNRNFDEIFEPSRSCFSGLIDTWASVPSGDKACNALNLLRNFFQPNIDEYNKVLAALSNDIDAYDTTASAKILRCHQLLVEIVEGYKSDQSKPAPNIHSFHHVLRACDHPISDDDTLQTVLFVVNDTFEKLGKLYYCRPDSQTYILMFKIIQARLPSISTDFAKVGKELFKSCCDEGLLTNATLKIVEKIIPDSFTNLKETFRSGDSITLSVGDLPPEWSCNRRKGQNQKRNRNRRNVANV